MVSNLRATSLGGTAVLLSWESSAPPPYFVYRDGLLVAKTHLTQYTLSLFEGESPLVEVTDDASAVPSPAYPAYALVAWYASVGADKYLVQEFVSSAWVTRAEVLDQGQGYFIWRSRILEDGLAHQFRVLPVGSNGNSGTIATLNAFMVRNPSPPAVRFTYSNASETVTIQAA